MDTQSSLWITYPYFESTSSMNNARKREEEDKEEEIGKEGIIWMYNTYYR